MATRRGGYRWTCPVCGATKLNQTVDGSGRTNAINALRAHLVATDGDEHGARNQYPDGFDPDALVDHVSRVDRRGDSVRSNE